MIEPLTPSIDRCTCGDWRADGWCWTCWHFATNRMELIKTNIAINDELRRTAA